MTTEERYWKLQPPGPTPPAEICVCSGFSPVKLSSVLSYNPINCVTCNLEIHIESLDLPTHIVDEVAYWRNIHDAVYRLWLDSNDYESWAATQLSDIHSYVNRLGLAARASVDRVRRCYYLFFQDQSADEYRPLSACPSCSAPPVNHTYGTFRYRVCESCGIVWWDE